MAKEHRMEADLSLGGGDVAVREQIVVCERHRSRAAADIEPAAVRGICHGRFRLQGGTMG